MAIQNFESEDLFVKELNSVLSASHPIRSIEHLHGREAYLRQIKQNLFADGRSIFIYGERGIGKSSLAATAAFLQTPRPCPEICVSADFALNEIREAVFKLNHKTV